MSDHAFVRRFLSLSITGAAACAAVGCAQQDHKPMAGAGTPMPTARMEALIAADTVISDGERMKMEADRTNDADLRRRGEARVAEGKQQQAAAAAMK